MAICRLHPFQSTQCSLPLPLPASSVALRFPNVGCTSSPSSDTEPSLASPTLFAPPSLGAPRPKSAVSGNLRTTSVHRPSVGSAAIVAHSLPQPRGLSAAPAMRQNSHSSSRQQCQQLSLSILLSSPRIYPHLTALHPTPRKEENRKRDPQFHNYFLFSHYSRATSVGCGDIHTVQCNSTNSWLTELEVGLG